MRGFSRFLLPAVVVVIVFLSPDLVHMRSAEATPPSAAQDVNVVSPLTNNGSVPVEATIKGIVKTRANPALTHVGALASDVVTLAQTSAGLREVRSDGTTSDFTAVPSGKALVITDIQWILSGTPGNTGIFSISFTQFDSTIVYLVSETVPDSGIVSRTTSMTTGIAFGPGTKPYFQGYSGELTYVHAHGYYLDTP